MLTFTVKPQPLTIFRAHKYARLLDSLKEQSEVLSSGTTTVHSPLCHFCIINKNHIQSSSEVKSSPTKSLNSASQYVVGIAFIIPYNIDLITSGTVIIYLG